VPAKKAARLVCYRMVSGELLHLRSRHKAVEQREWMMPCRSGKSVGFLIASRKVILLGQSPRLPPPADAESRWQTGTLLLPFRRFPWLYVEWVSLFPVFPGWPFLARLLAIQGRVRASEQPFLPRRPSVPPRAPSEAERAALE